MRRLGILCAVLLALSACGGDGGLPPPPPDPERIAFQSRRANNSNDIFVMDSGGGGVLPVWVEATVEDIEPALSPDGTRIVFVSNRSGSQRLYAIDVDGTDFDSLGPLGRFPSWTPNGTQILFVNNGSLLTVSAAGGTPAPLGNPGMSVAEPAVSPDGSRIAFENGGDVWLYRIGAGSPAQLTTDVAAEGLPAWSPDGARIAFVRLSTIMSMDTTGGDVRTISANSTDPVFSPDGNHIAYAGLRGVNVQVLRRPVGGGAERPIATAGTSSGRPSWRATQ